MPTVVFIMDRGGKSTHRSGHTARRFQSKTAKMQLIPRQLLAIKMALFLQRQYIFVLKEIYYGIVKVITVTTFPDVELGDL